MAKGKHLILEDRITILFDIKKGSPLQEIAKKVGKDSIAVSKEIMKHR